MIEVIFGLVTWCVSLALYTKFGDGGYFAAMVVCTMFLLNHAHTLRREGEDAATG
jgi:hypothetical protein